MSLLRFPSGVTDCVAMIVLVVLSVSMMATCLERDFTPESKYYTRRLVPIENPRNYFQFFHDMEPWKRTPSAGWFGMRGKKVVGSNFFGMRGKKGPSGFLGMRGKKMDPFPQQAAIADDTTSNELYPPVDSFEDVWTFSKPRLEQLEDLEATDSSRHHNPDPQERLLESGSMVKTNHGKINI